MATWLSSERAIRQPFDEATLAWWRAATPERARVAERFGFHSLIVVPLRARGVTLGYAMFCRHRTPEPFNDDDLALAEDLASRAAVCVDNARRYTRERSTALALQRSLLPRRLPGQQAMEAASRYLPAGTGADVGGDWFDVIPLSGARVALVVGDVVGHGIHALATMGRLRTAVRTLADVDLAPDELLTHLDDLVLRLDEEERLDGGAHRTGLDAGEGAGEVGATCLYVVYDPVTALVCVSSAGHPPPAVVTPDGEARMLDVSPGPPLGLGGLPFESVEAGLPAGSLLALYTDGLLHFYGRDIDEGFALLCRALARPAHSLDETCDGVLEALGPRRHVDDIALLVARTRILDGTKVAVWELPSDPAVVARARALVAERLAAWGLEEFVFVTELVVSELVTNAIRYGAPPLQLRLIRDSSLICEVSDGSSTSPHLRRARILDEGGRGLLLVAQLTRCWGTRHSPTGKIIWAEQPLTPPADGL